MKKKFVTEKGVKGDYFIMDDNGTSFIIPIKGDKIVLIKQYRYPINAWSIEIPGGSIKDGSNYLRTAKEELEEEVGYKAGKWQYIGKFSSINGVSSDICKIYIASDLKKVEIKQEETENIKIIEIPIKEAYKLIEENKIQDGMTMAALALARKHLLK